MFCCRLWKHAQSPTFKLTQFFSSRLLQDVHPNSPAATAGLQRHTDYILSAVELIFKDEDDLDYVITRCQNVAVSFYVYSMSADCVREITITPNPAWGGEGSLGCDIGRGILHKLPFAQAREAARMAQLQYEQDAELFRTEQLESRAPMAATDASVSGLQPAGIGVQTGAANLSAPPKSTALVRRRAAAAVVGAFVADAATMGCHWIYDMVELQTLLATHSAKPEFHEPPANKYYAYKSGVLSPYGDQALVLLRGIANGTGDLKCEFDPQHFSELLLSFGRSYHGYVDHATSGFCQHMDAGRRWPDCGADDNQANCLMKIAPMVARYAGTGLLEDKISEARPTSSAVTVVHVLTGLF